MAIKIKLIKSISGRKKSHIATVKSLGLDKIGQTVVQPDNDATKGKINAVRYLVETAEVSE
ncbi:MAG: 50S ribosomal protein L30 [Oscillospiraceae bacterium]|jgi:large subunit ribosomal protein L30|nr:50S ribosomal protein L30 [Oscillospiraceae bacterium]